MEARGLNGSDRDRSGAPAAAWSGTVFLQTVGIVVAWLVPAILHADNDGLWFLGDAARHALNGLFWWDLLTTLPHDPREYFLRYYARYPAITPVSYPPVFYVLEGAAFRIFGPSPYVAKWLVLGLSLIACLYVAAWLRRYVARDAGWGGALLALQPGVITWSSAVMLNIPAMTFGVVGLYYGRRWLEDRSARCLLLAFTFAALAALTYYPAALVVIVLSAWLAGEGRWRAVWTQHRTVAVLIVAVLGALALTIMYLVPLPLDLALSNLQQLRNPDKWLAYIRALPKLLHTSILVLAVLAFPAAIVERRWRRDVRLLTVWILITYAGLSYFWSQSPRYALLLAPAVVMLAIIGLQGGLNFAAFLLGVRPSRWLAAVLIGLAGVDLAFASAVPLRSIEGFKDVAAFVLHEAPTERVLYEGGSDGVFTFYLRAQDPGFSRAVIRGSKLLYSSAIFSTWRLTEKVASPSDVISALESGCGCGWVVLEQPGLVDEVNAVRYLQQAVQGPEFRLVRSFPVTTSTATHIDVYQFLRPFSIPETIELPFPILGGDASFRARPIER